jgi:predicted aminopeptidase
MNPTKKKLTRLKQGLIIAVLALVVVAVSGCRTLSFYGQAIQGQYHLFADAEPAKRLLANPNTPAKLKSRLELVTHLREFAGRDLKLPVDGHYLKYVDVHRPFVVWNVQAAREFSLEPKTWWYPLVGRLEYRGYFSKEDAQRYGDYLSGKGYDVYLGGATAYSTLGWFKDPLLSTFIFDPEPDLAEVLFHELAHQQLFARGDTDFNEAFATTVGREGARRWLKTTGNPAAAEAYEAQLRRTDQFVRLVLSARSRLEALYGDARDKNGKIKATAKNDSLPREELRRQKARVISDLRTAYEKLRSEWGGNGEYDLWFAREINNAKLNSIAAYYDFVPGFERLLRDNSDNLELFYRAAERLSKLKKEERHQRLRELARIGG